MGLSEINGKFVRDFEFFLKTEKNWNLLPEKD
ncbi:hypothetical protein M2137_000416 [Parabacteroides sp. PFB2-10]|nr:hypothetical protein [Parabacteroides sp. PFB2-10]